MPYKNYKAKLLCNKLRMRRKRAELIKQGLSTNGTPYKQPKYGIPSDEELDRRAERWLAEHNLC